MKCMEKNNDDALELDRQVCFALAVASRSVINIYRPILEPLGLTHPQYLVMLALWGDGKLRFKTLAEMLRLDAATLSPIIKRLEHSGLIERVPAVDDDRTFDIIPTELGKNLREKALEVPPAVVKRLGLSIEYLASLRDTLTTIIQAVDEVPSTSK